MELDLNVILRKHALRNAILHGGKADVNAVVKKLLAEKPEVRSRLRELIDVVRKTVDEVNSLTLDEQRRILEEEFPEVLEKPGKEERKLPPLPAAEGFEKVVTRFAPEPNGFLHLGHAKAAVLSYEYAKMYGGTFILRFEDTNPKAEKAEFYEAIKEDLRALGLSWDVEKVVSDDIEFMYGIAKSLLERGLSYVCICPTKELREKRRRGEECVCRHSNASRNLELFDGMLEGKFSEGEAVVRLKTSMKARNYALRDPVILRIIDYPHPLKGDRYHVYPTYDFACAVEDHELRVSHILRSIEFVMRVDIQEEIFKAMGWPMPVAIQFGRLNMEGVPLSKRKITPLIKDGLVKGWDDPRLATLRGLWRRGIRPEAVKKLILDVGPSKANALITWELLSSYNRKVVDPIANRFFFVPHPKLMIVSGTPPISTVKIKLHPNFPERGFRELHVDGLGGEVKVFVDGEEVAQLAKRKFRLIGLFNVEVQEIEEVVHARYAGDELIDPKVQWVPAERNVKVSLTIPTKLFLNGGINLESLKVMDGLGEETCSSLKPGDLVQFERIGFARIDEVEDKEVKAILTHR
ncbi:MAG: glutamate--tRNA ligase [Thermoprotei archaeon]|nr:MAG: glutamate--tRNA ligase [Thermoprotei archaeon]